MTPATACVQPLWSSNQPGLRSLLTIVPLLVVLALTAASCRLPVGPSSPVVVTLEPDESIRIERTRLRFVEVVSDDRCPLNALCIHPGDVVVAIELTVTGSTREFEMALNDPDRRAVVYRDIRLTLQAVEPYPVGGSPTHPDDYRASFELASD
jgi:hypothetical protein